MGASALERASRFLWIHDIQQTELPVDLSQLYDRFVPEYRDLSQYAVLGMGMFPPDGEVTIYRPAKIVIEGTLSDDARRLVYAHELGHFICGHLNGVVTASLDAWQHGRCERDAWLAAAVLLVPGQLGLSDMTMAQIAAACEVPEWLVTFYRDRLRASW